MMLFLSSLTSCKSNVGTLGSEAILYGTIKSNHMTRISYWRVLKACSLGFSKLNTHVQKIKQLHRKSIPSKSRRPVVTRLPDLFRHRPLRLLLRLNL